MMLNKPKNEFDYFEKESKRFKRFLAVIFIIGFIWIVIALSLT